MGCGEQKRLLQRRGGDRHVSICKCVQTRKESGRVEWSGRRSGMAGISFLGSVNPCFSSGTPFHPTSHKRDCGKTFVRPSVRQRESVQKRSFSLCSRKRNRAGTFLRDGRTDGRTAVISSVTSTNANARCRGKRGQIGVFAPHGVKL